MELTQSPQDHIEVGPSPSVQANINKSTRQNKTSTVPYKIDVLNQKFLTVARNVTLTFKFGMNNFTMIGLEDHDVVICENVLRTL